MKSNLYVIIVLAAVFLLMLGCAGRTEGPATEEAGTGADQLVESSSGEAETGMGTEAGTAQAEGSSETSVSTQETQESPGDTATQEDLSNLTQAIEELNDLNNRMTDVDAIDIDADFDEFVGDLE